ncbi:hypothetical protein [Microbacterium imperiale]|uniref:Phosphodiesterase n=1 Tax=Microbacterium imperiale TaxID=33884 RepID=A0A9W6HJ80_9MICO|nr:hypothetical protein [Microbacterium imperiale]MBP2421522.1 hypothetical protein [Microbacterium imperiale]MDS0199370.1 hypothetical protein [Microbacterium imperiale]BFE41861.1 hypothetical protein GCM10017544_28170 [Microbacterium imperiale]GLJ80813.1 hypothetical protein GCM10017586_24960 [Microbacterium imperiale]
MKSLHPAPVAAVIGSGLRAIFGAMLLVRRPRPIHPRGRMLAGTVRWVGERRRTGIDWIDSPPPSGEMPVTARVSRSIGLPDALPDILGLALRVQIDGGAAGGAADGTADIEFASTGRAFPLRFALLPVRRAERARYGILLPYRGRRGPVLLSAKTLDGSPTDAAWRLVLAAATPLGRWQPFALVRLQPLPEQTPQPRFDAGTRVLPGARMYPWVRALRQPSYDVVQRESAVASATTPPPSR